MSLKKIFLTGLAAIALATPVFAQQKINCDSKLDYLSQWVDHMEENPETVAPPTFLINHGQKDLTEAQYQCMSEGIKKRTYGKYQFSRHENNELGLKGYILERTK